VGHASLATGAYPADHGMVANVWLDRQDIVLHYNIEDPKHRLLTAGAGDELTLDFAKALVINEGIGQDDITDYLAISFSSTDYINHLFGPSSLEAEENQRRLDRTLAELFSFIDAKVGLDKTLIVLAADHGSPEVPGYLNALGIEAGYFDTKTLDRQPAIAALKKRFGIGDELIEKYFHPYLYLNRELIQQKGLDQAEVERAVAAELLKFPGLSLAVSSEALLRGDVPDTWQMRAVLRNHAPARSGDIYIVFAPHTFINDFDGLIVAATHGSPWHYDSYVPVILAGHGVERARISRLVSPYDIAPTLSAYLGITPPSGSSGLPLVEILKE
jgi:predicted AlkP superfamily pyrophosphatase or phosphodiesterase